MDVLRNKTAMAAYLDPVDFTIGRLQELHRLSGSSAVKILSSQEMVSDIALYRMDLHQQG